jgi:hypothetical protein
VKNRSFILILVIVGIFALVGAWGGYVMLAEPELHEYETGYMGHEKFENIDDAKKFQDELLKVSDEYGAKINVSISVNSPPVVSYSVSSETPFPYGDHNPYFDPLMYTIMCCFIGYGAAFLGLFYFALIF